MRRKIGVLALCGFGALTMVAGPLSEVGSAGAGLASKHAVSVTHPCTLLTDAHIKQLVGVSASSPMQMAGFDPGEIECMWNLSTTNGGISVTYEPKTTKSDLTETDGELGSGATRVSGVGSVAYVSCSGKQNGVPSQCELRGFGSGKTLSIVLSGTGTEKAISKQISRVGAQVFKEL
jgi:hypothetical protein